MIFGEGPIIKNIAGDLNKLFLQGSRVGQPVTNVEGDAAADQGTADLLAAMDPVIQEVAVGMSGEESRQYTVSGTPPLSLANSLGMPLKSWSVDVSPYQEGTGDPAPDNVRPIHGTDKLNMFVENSYDQSATPKAVFTLPQTVYTGTIGSEGGESRWASYTATGNETLTQWELYGASTNIAAVITSIGGNLAYADYVDGAMNAMCDMLPQVTNVQMYLKRTDHGVCIMNNKRIAIQVEGVTTLAEMSAWLAENKPTFVYKMATPTTFAVPSPTIPTPTGTATTWATAENGTVDSMEVTYIGKASS